MASEEVELLREIKALLARPFETIDAAHKNIHDGISYTTADTQACDTTTIKWQIHTPNAATAAHLVFSLSGTGEALFVVTEGSDRDDGTALTEVNRNRTSPLQLAKTIITRTPTGGSTDGTIVLFSTRSGITGQGAKPHESGQARATNEWVLKPDTKYVISITTYAATYVTAIVDWYEKQTGL